MGSGKSSAVADVSVLSEVQAAVRAEAYAERAKGLPLKTAAPIIARRLGLPSPRRVLAYLHGEVAEDDVRAIELEAVRRARERTVRALAEGADDAVWAARLERVERDLAELMRGRAADAAMENHEMAAGQVGRPGRALGGAL